MIKYISTRGIEGEVSAAQAIIKGLADDKGLYVPTKIPTLQDAFSEGVLTDVLSSLKGLPFQTIAEKTLKAFYEDFTDVEIRACIDGAYTSGADGKFSKDEIVPVVKVGNNDSDKTDMPTAFFLELYHGRTSAFKDMALSILPYLLTTAIKKEGEDSKICILTATSGDTGKAALAGFADVPGTEIVVFYPDGGVSEVQRAQMVTQEGENTHVFAIKGNFDDAQTGVKQIFNDPEFASKLAEINTKLSSANSINIGRLIPQVAYYIYGYGQLIKQGVINPSDPINIVVPTGNFGNILAAYYASLMGIPVNKFICASNENKVLTDFINTGVYDARREFYLTNSPSMDILISSNLERLLFHLSKGNAAEVKKLMAKLDDDKWYEVGDQIKAGLSKFYGGFADISETNNTIGKMYREREYLLDTHTAVAYKVYEDYVNETGDYTPTIIASTASPFKFARSVAESVGITGLSDDFEYVNELSKASGIEIPAGLRDLNKKEIRHKDTIEISSMAEAVEQSLR